MATHYYAIALSIALGITGCSSSSSEGGNSVNSDGLNTNGSDTNGGNTNSGVVDDPVLVVTPPAPTPSGTVNFDSLVASNAAVETVLNTCRTRYNELNNFFTTQPDIIQVAREVTTGNGSTSSDAIEVQWILPNRDADTTQGVAIEANSAGAVLTLAGPTCDVEIFQGFGLNQDRTDTLVKYKNPSTDISACVGETPQNATSVETFPLYDIAGTRYGLYRNDYIATENAQEVAYTQVYETHFNGSTYVIHCPEPTVISTRALLPEVALASLELVPGKIFRITWQPVSGAEFYRVLENSDGISGYNTVADQLSASETSYDHRVALYTRTNALYIVQACNQMGCTDSDELMVSDNLSGAVGYFKAHSESEGERLVSVSLSADGSIMAMGAYGAVFMYTYENGEWQKRGYLKKTNGLFGHRVSLSADGTTLAIGASSDSSSSAGINGNQFDESLRASGAVFIYVNVNGEWLQQAFLKASNPGEFDRFGDQVSLNADGNTLVVGAYAEDSSAKTINGIESDNAASNAGAAYVFTRQGTAWSQQAYLKADVAGVVEFFGRSVSISANGNTIAIGANELVYVFSRSAQVWSQSARVGGPNAEFGDAFGDVLALSADGLTLAVGAQGEDSNSAGVDGDWSNNRLSASGAAYVFELDESRGLWLNRAYLKASNPTEGSVFGYTMSISANGNKLAIGSIREGGASTGINGDQNDNGAVDSGAVYMFDRQDGIWQQQAYIKASNTDNGDRFGSWISLSGDGESLAICAWGEDSTARDINGDQTDETGDKPGAVYLY